MVNMSEKKSADKIHHSTKYIRNSAQVRELILKEQMDILKANFPVDLMEILLDHESYTKTKSARINWSAVSRASGISIVDLKAAFCKMKELLDPPDDESEVESRCKNWF